MNPYYTANTIFVVLAMMIMLAAVSFNTTLDQQRKNIHPGPVSGHQHGGTVRVAGQCAERHPGRIDRAA